MALPAQLKTARMTNDTLGIDIDDKVAEIEQALCDILGFTPGVDITESPLGCDNSGRITKALLRLYAAGPVGLRYRDTTAGKEVRIALSGTNLVIDENTGTEGTPVWTNRATMAIATGVWTFTGIPVGPDANPTTDHQLTRKKYVVDLIAAYQALSEKGVASGYAGLDAAIKVPTAQLGGAGADVTKFLRGDQSWAAPGGAQAFPIGAIYLSITGANPATELGYGTWAAFGAGRMLVGLETAGAVAIADLSKAAACVVTWNAHGLGTGDKVMFEGITQAQWTAINGLQTITYVGVNSFSIPVNTSGYTLAYVPATDPGTYREGSFVTVEQTGGDKRKNLSHTHSTPAHNHGVGATYEAYDSVGGGSGGGSTTDSAGSAAQNVLNPYIVVHMWKRTA